jgi:hypothetical protein
MNFFSSDAFLESMIKVHFRGRHSEIGDHWLDGCVYRLLSIDGHVVSDWPFLDFFEAREGEESNRRELSKVSYLPRVAVGQADVQGGPPMSLVPGQQFAPRVDWSRFTSWEAFEKHVARQRSQLFADSARRERKLAKNVGPVTFSYHEPSDEAFRQCRDWKSAQYISTGGTDRFFRDNLPLFEELLQRQVLVSSTLRAGGKLLAVIWSAFEAGRLYYWVPAYDPAFSGFSPGRLLLHHLLHESHRQGHRELDLLIGNEDYKWHYATDTRIIGPEGEPPLRLRLERVLKARVKNALSSYPGALEAARKLRKMLRR